MTDHAKRALYLDVLTRSYEVVDKDNIILDRSKGIMIDISDTRISSLYQRALCDRKKLNGIIQKAFEDFDLTEGGLFNMDIE